MQWLDYRETQREADQTLDRMRVRAWSTRWQLPMAETWSLDLTTVVDVISGASPTWYAVPDSFGEVDDRRRAADVKLVREWGRWRTTLGLATSSEADYRSLGRSLRVARASEDRNLVFDLAYSDTRDRIDPVNRVVSDERKAIRDGLLGVTWVASPVDVVQVQLVRSLGEGYYSDPYKLLDQRPRERRQSVAMLRWNHHRIDWETTFRFSLRAYQDSWGLRSQTLGVDTVVPLAPYLSAASGWTVTPSVRLYSQNAARFFAPPDPAAPERPRLPADFRFGETLLSFDQRLAAFGALTLGLKLDWQLSPRTRLNLKWEAYRQRNDWAWNAPGTAGLPDFQARFLGFGFSRILD